ncbi:MAG: hypothetical protein E7252_06830 [Lachnospira sp.]|nr:hypothetical protein [Lachnospira sp.]
MNENLLRIFALEKRIESSHNLRFKLKAISATMIFIIFLICFLNPENNMHIPWCFSMVVIIVFFILDSYYLKHIKNYEWEIYHLQLKDLEAKKELSMIKDGYIPDSLLNREYKEPEPLITLSVSYYIIILLINVLIRIFMVYS